MVQPHTVHAQSNQCFARITNGAIYSSTNAVALRTAIGAEPANGTVKIAGVCAGAVTMSASMQVALITKTLTIQGGYTTTNWTVSNPISNPTLLDALNNGRVIRATQALTVENLIIQNGRISGSGGGIYARNNLWLIGGQVRNNIANGSSGAGGGVWVNGSATIIGTTFFSNTANTNGGGTFINGSATVTGSTWSRNTSRAGGALYLAGISATPMRVANNQFARNRALKNRGNAIYTQGIRTTSRLFVLHNTIANPTLEGGSAIYVVTGTVGITNTIIASHTLGIEAAGGRVYQNYNLFFGNGSNISGTVTSDGQSRIGDPAFVNLDFEDFRLRANSAALHYAANVWVTSDIAGARRPQGAGFDVGAFESSYNLPELFISDASLNEGDSGTGIASFIVTLTNPSATPITVEYATLSGNAIGEDDYVSNRGVLTFTPGVTNQTISITVSGDMLVEDNETFTITLANASNASLSDAIGVGTIRNDDGAVLSIGNTQGIEGDDSTVNFSFIVTLTNASSITITVAYATGSSTATGDEDYASDSGILTFAPGVISQTIPITVNGDTLVETDETFILVLSNAFGATISNDVATGIIYNNDNTRLSIGNTNVPEGDTGSVFANITVTLTNASAIPITVDYSTREGTANADSDYVSTTGTLTFASYETEKVISIDVISDRLDENDETFFLTLSNPQNALLDNESSVGSATIIDDDTVTFALHNTSVLEGDTGTVVMSFVLSLSNPAATTLLLDFSTFDLDAIAGVDYEGRRDTLSIPTGETTGVITVAVKGDTEIEGNEALNLKVFQGNAIEVASALGTIINDDTTPTTTSTATATSTPTDTATPMPTETATSTETSTPTATPTETGSEIPILTPTATNTPTDTTTPTSTETSTPTETPTETGSETPILTPTATNTPQRSDLRLILNSNPPANSLVVSGTQIDYMLTVSNTGKLANNVVLSIELPANVTVLSDSLNPPTTTLQAAQAESGLLTNASPLIWRIELLASDTSFQANFAVIVNDLSPVQIQGQLIASGITLQVVTIGHSVTPTSLEVIEEPQAERQQIYLPLVLR